MLNLSQSDRVLIVGFGMTGRALAHFCDSRHFRYYVFDDKKPVRNGGTGFLGAPDCAQAQKLIAAGQIRAVFPSPGVLLTHPVIRAAQKMDVPIIGELELASFYLKGEFIAVTGTNGKSTTVRLINALLKDASIDNSLKGNIGSPLISAVNEPPKPFYVVEASSYQLELIGSLRHKVAICLNVAPDHLDRYQGLEDYARAKAGIIKNSGPGDFFIFNYDDPYCYRMAAASRARNIPFSLVNRFEEGGFVEGGQLVIRLGRRAYRFETRQAALKGLHNTENMLAALAAALVIRNDERAVASYQNTLATFSPLPHRLEGFLTHNGVAFYDDSKATNVHAVVMALASFDGNVILIAGGKDKNSDFKPLRELIRAKVKMLILMGEARYKMKDALKNGIAIELAETMQEAAVLACRAARPGDVVLLSPACASFDRYKNYEERGEDFKRCVREICGQNL